MSGLFSGTALERPVTCEVCEKPLDACPCPRDANGNVLLPRDQCVIIRLQKRAKGKVMTTVTGLDPVASDLAALLKTLKKRCGAGGAEGADGIEIQGDHRDTIAVAMRDAGFQVSRAPN